MPRKVEWTRLIPRALEELRAMDVPVIDRATLERLLEISARQALRVLTRFPASYPAGKSLLIGREELMAALEETGSDEEVQREGRRRERIRDTLAATRRELAARQVRIVAPTDVETRRIPDLPAGIHLQPGELRIEFSGAEELLRHLLELSKAIMNDYGKFEALVDDRPPRNPF